MPGLRVAIAFVTCAVIWKEDILFSLCILLSRNRPYEESVDCNCFENLLKDDGYYRRRRICYEGWHAAVHEDVEGTAQPEASNTGLSTIICGSNSFVL